VGGWCGLGSKVFAEVDGAFGGAEVGGRLGRVVLVWGG